MIRLIRRHRSPGISPPHLPAGAYFRLAGWIVWTARGLFHAGLIDARGLLAALKCYHLVSRLGMRAWRAERRKLLR